MNYTNFAEDGGHQRIVKQKQKASGQLKPLLGPDLWWFLLDFPTHQPILDTLNLQKDLCISQLDVPHKVRNWCFGTAGIWKVGNSVRLRFSGVKNKVETADVIKLILEGLKESTYPCSAGQIKKKHKRSQKQQHDFATSVRMTTPNEFCKLILFPGTAGFKPIPNSQTAGLLRLSMRRFLHKLFVGGPLLAWPRLWDCGGLECYWSRHPYELKDGPNWPTHFLGVGGNTQHHLAGIGSCLLVTTEWKENMP